MGTRSAVRRTRVSALATQRQRPVLMLSLSGGRGEGAWTGPHLFTNRTYHLYHTSLCAVHGDRGELHRHVRYLRSHAWLTRSHPVPIGITIWRMDCDDNRSHPRPPARVYPAVPLRYAQRTVARGNGPRGSAHVAYTIVTFLTLSFTLGFSPQRVTAPRRDRA